MKHGLYKNTQIIDTQSDPSVGVEKPVRFVYVQVFTNNEIINFRAYTDNEDQMRTLRNLQLGSTVTIELPLDGYAAHNPSDTIYRHTVTIFPANVSQIKCLYVEEGASLGGTDVPES